ncbi:MAG: NADH-quinone oxidoreductase subunit L [Chloroflexi bacterium]|nr:NADH-quinone oxidoreductase subunit L [Chloroflexota bacterium]
MVSAASILDILSMSGAWLAPVLCLLAFGILAFFSRYLPGKGAWLSILAIGIGFLLFFPVAADYLRQGRPGVFALPWFAVGGKAINLGMVIDPLSVVMLGVVTSVALGVQVYSVGYMKGDPRFGWYFAAQSLFAASMLGLILADNFLVLYATWELVGLCSYLLIGFWWEKRSAAEAAKKAFITTRIGDVGLLLGILVLFKATGTFEMKGIFEAAQNGAIPPTTLTIAALLIFLGAMGKSAQFPLHVWLPDAMEGPTPVSALIHAATMVAAGVYLVARSFPLFLAAPGALTVVALIGLITMLLASTMAIVMTDLKRVIAYSTVSKLGFMMLALGFGGLTAGIFFLATHAFFKALLFLGAGSVIHATDKQDVKDLGGLGRKMPLTAATFLIGALALAGLPPLSGFWSKDEVLVALAGNPLVFALALLSIFLTGIYIGRLCLLIFFGEPRDHHAYEHAHDAPLAMAAPMAALALLSIFAGFVALDAFGPALGLPPQFKGIGSFLYAHGPETFKFHLDIALLSTLAALAGLAVAWAVYSRKLVSPEVVAKRFRFFYDLAANKYYMDVAYQAFINRVVLVVAGAVALFDRLVVNDTAVNGTGKITVFAGVNMRFHETGKLYNYGLGMTLGLLLLIAAVVLVV